MGSVCSGGHLTPEQQELRDRNSRIERELERSNRSKRDQIKILLLGPGESGKSTVFKQLQLLQPQAEQNFDYRHWKYIVWGNCIEGMQKLVKGARSLNINLDNEENNQLAAQVERLRIDGFDWTPSLGHSLKSLWLDKGIHVSFLFTIFTFHLIETNLCQSVAIY